MIRSGKNQCQQSWGHFSRKIWDSFVAFDRLTLSSRDEYIKEIFMNCCNTLKLGLEIFTSRIYYIHLHANVSQSTIQGQSHLSKDSVKWEWELFFYWSIIYATKHFFSHICIFIYFSKLVCDVHWVLSYPSKSNFGNELIQLNIITKA